MYNTQGHRNNRNGHQQRDGQRRRATQTQSTAAQPLEKNERVPPAAVWAGLEPVVQSEASQKEKSKCHILRNISGNIGIGDLIYKAEIETQTWRTNIWIPGG